MVAAGGTEPVLPGGSVGIEPGSPLAGIRRATDDGRREEAEDSASGPKASITTRAAMISSSQEPKRRSGCLSIAFSMTASRPGGRPLRRSVSFGGSSCRCAYRTAMSLSRGKGTSPVSVWKIMQASA